MTGRGARVLLIGCGKLGSYHLQAVASLPAVAEIEVVDPRPEALAIGQQRVAELPNRSRDLRIRWLTSLEQVSRGGDLCLVATHASGRAQLVEHIARALDYQTFLVEKLVAQSIAEYAALVEFCRLHGLNVWVNFQTRGHPFHRTLKERLDPSEPIVLSVVAGNNGLVTNGVHWADLFVAYDGCSSIEHVGSIIDPVLHSSGRGPHLFDLSGTLCGRTAKGSHLVLSYVGTERSAYEPLSLSSPSVRVIVDYVAGWAAQSDARSGWTWQTCTLGASLYVSETTRVFVSDLLGFQRCHLPTLEEAFAAHRFVLDGAQPAFNQLLNRETEACPVT